MADAAAARREARRRRVLENSQDRLKLISGNSTSKNARDSPVPAFNTELISEESSVTSLAPSINNGVLYTPSEPIVPLPTSESFIAGGDGEVTHDFAPFSPPPVIIPAEPKRSKPLWEIVVEHKYDVVLLSLLIQLLYSLSLFTIDNTYFFVPLIVYVVTKLIWFPTESRSNIANAFLLLNGISANRVDKLLAVSHWVGVMTQDVCVYLFTTICIQSLLLTFNNNQIT